MKKTIVFWAVVAGLLCGCLALAGCGGDGDGGGMNQEQWNNTVRMGMTPDEVNAAVGRPPDRQFQSWYYWRFDNDEGGATYGSNGRVAGTRWANDMY